MSNEFVYNQKTMTPQQMAKLIVAGFVLLLVIMTVMTSFYTVDTDSEAVVQRFGKFVRIESAGLHFKLPSPMEQVTKVPVLNPCLLDPFLPGCTNDPLYCPPSI